MTCTVLTGVCDSSTGTGNYFVECRYQPASHLPIKGNDAEEKTRAQSFIDNDIPVGINEYISMRVLKGSFV